MTLEQLIAEEKKYASNNKEGNQNELDRLLLTLLGGSFGVSITVFTNFAEKILYEEYLFWIWKMLALALTLQILNYTFAVYVSHKSLQGAKRLEYEFASKSSDLTKRKEESNRWLRFVRRREWMNFIIDTINPCVAALTIVTMVALVIFGISNVAEIKARARGEAEAKISSERILQEELRRLRSIQPTVNNIYFQIEK